MKENPFYTSKKFIYAALSVVAAVALAVLPGLLNADGEQTQELHNLIQWVLGMGFALVGGHTFMDALSMWKGVQIPSLPEAVSDLVDAIKEPESIKS